jgi:hypothetical protein
VLTAASGASAQSNAALEQLCRAYWHPLYAYVERSRYAAAEAELGTAAPGGLRLVIFFGAHRLQAG